MTTRRAFLKTSAGLLVASGANLAPSDLLGTASAAVPAKAKGQLAADGFFPQGRKMVFAGYSGDPARDLAKGFTVAGPVYGDQTPYLKRCFENRWPVIAHVGPKITFKDDSPDKYKLEPASLQQSVQKQVQELAAHKEIVWWGVHPEELRTWRRSEMDYLKIVCETIRKADPLARPIFHYNPNHRDAKGLAPIAEQVDILAKGCYVNSAGKKRDRAWVRWSVEQEVEALRVAGRPNAIPLVMPELCKNPEPEEECEIRAWVRHDVYLGLASGAKGVLIWSLFKRPAVKRTWQLWYDAYCECAQELNGPQGLAQVFLFGKKQTTLQVRQVQGSDGARVKLGGTMEPNTTSEQERAQREVKLPSWTAAEFESPDGRWLFLVNSANAPAAFAVNGLPQGAALTNAFNGHAVKTDGRSVRLDLAAYEVVGLRVKK